MKYAEIAPLKKQVELCKSAGHVIMTVETAKLEGLIDMVEIANDRIRRLENLNLDLESDLELAKRRYDDV